MAEALLGERDDGEFLRSLFPDVEAEKLTNALEEADGSVEAAAEVLLLDNDLMTQKCIIAEDDGEIAPQNATPDSLNAPVNVPNRRHSWPKAQSVQRRQGKQKLTL